MTGAPTNLGELVDGALAAAASHPHGRHSVLLTGGSDHLLRQVMMALAAGQSLQDHENPGEATLQVLSGRIRVTAGDEQLELGATDWAPVPNGRHGVTALTDAAFVLTVAKHP